MDAQRLIGLWGERDDRYAVRWADGRPSPLSEIEEACVRELRAAEIERLLAEGKGKAACVAYMATWKPPVVVAWARNLIRDLDADNARHRARWATRSRGEAEEKEKGAAA